LTTLNGVDSLVINSIKTKTQKQVVIKTRQTKVTGDKHDEDKEKHHWGYSRESLKDAVDRANKLLQNSSAYLCLQIMQKNGEIKILLMDMDSKAIISEVPPAKVFQLIKRFDNYKGFAVDRLT